MTQKVVWTVSCWLLFGGLHFFLVPFYGSEGSPEVRQQMIREVGRQP